MHLKKFFGLFLIDREKILRYMDEYYVANNAVVSIVGNFDEKMLLQTIENKFGTWKVNNKLNKLNEIIDYNFEVHIT